tara:strand:- start:7881 stop:8909 length:1029 start_codon:yes stop_codon:yes gene_type:complete
MFENNNLFITSNDFSKFSDFIYSDRESLDDKNFLEDTEVIEISKDPQFRCLTYKKLNFEIKSGDVIFCNTNQIDNLFYHLKKFNKLENLSLITHQTDKLITKKDFEKRPASIYKWFSVNVGYNNKSLIPIPIGLASDFSLKNLNSTDFSDFNKNNFYKDEIKMYINFKTNTNFHERKLLYKQFENKSWVDIDPPDLNKNIYLNKLKISSFVLCPWGNGIDTHRFWETLYSGSIPVTKKHKTYEAAKDLPVLFVDDYNEIGFDLLSDFMKNLDLKKYNFKKLTKNYWNEEVSNKKKYSNFEKIIETKFESSLFRIKRNIYKIYNSYIKKLKTFFYRVKKKLDS